MILFSFHIYISLVQLCFVRFEILFFSRSCSFDQFDTLFLFYVTDTNSVDLERYCNLRYKSLRLRLGNTYGSHSDQVIVRVHVKSSFV